MTSPEAPSVPVATARWTFTPSEAFRPAWGAMMAQAYARVRGRPSGSGWMTGNSRRNFSLRNSAR